MKKKKISPVAIFLRENHNIQVNWSKNFTFFANKSKNKILEKKKVCHLRASMDVLFSCFKEPTTYPSLSYTSVLGEIVGFFEPD